jgi:hypothetical protein
MDEEEQKMQEYIEAYLQASPPVFWVDWCGRCHDKAARQSVESVLFRDEVLRDLTDPVVRLEVLEAIRQQPSMMELVIADADDLVEEIVKYGKTDHEA